MLICLVHAWNSGWRAIAIANWLSKNIIDGVDNGNSSLVRSEQCHKTCLATWVAAMYLASGVEGATVFCFFELQAMAPLQ